jgi:hypothetical protein
MIFLMLASQVARITGLSVPSLFLFFILSPKFLGSSDLSASACRIAGTYSHISLHQAWVPWFCW